jgi:plastocyanin
MMNQLVPLLFSAILMVLGACSSGEEQSPQEAKGDVEIEAGDNTFEPGSLELAANREVSIEITNTGDVPHDFAIEELSIATDTIAPGESVTATVNVPEGSTEFVCTLHPGMTGTITTQ